MMRTPWNGCDRGIAFVGPSLLPVTWISSLCKHSILKTQWFRDCLFAQLLQCLVVVQVRSLVDPLVGRRTLYYSVCVLYTCIDVHVYTYIYICIDSCITQNYANISGKLSATKYDTEFCHVSVM